jgi:hypothetical protein
LTDLLRLEDCSHLVDELLGVEWLVDEVVGTRFRTAGAVVRLLLAAQHHDRDLRGLLLDLLAQCIPALLAQVGVDEHHTGLLSAESLESFSGVLRQDRAVLVLTREGDFQHPTHGFAVVDSQERGGHRSSEGILAALAISSIRSREVSRNRPRLGRAASIASSAWLSHDAPSSSRRPGRS